MRIVYTPTYLYSVASFACFRQTLSCRQTVFSFVPLSYKRFLPAAKTLVKHGFKLERETSAGVFRLRKEEGAIQRAPRTFWFASETLTIYIVSIDVFRVRC